MRNLVRSKFRVKIKYLAEESRIIRHEISRYKGDDNAPIRDSLCMHRTWDVRRESRSTFWAYAYLRGIPYRSIEHKTNLDEFNRRQLTKRTAQIIKSLSGKEVSVDELREWLSASPVSV